MLCHGTTDQALQRFNPTRLSAGNEMAGSDLSSRDRPSFNPTRLSAGNEIQAVGAELPGAVVSIQPGCPPGMRYSMIAREAAALLVSIQPGCPPGMRCRTCKCLILRANRPVLREPVDRRVG